VCGGGSRKWEGREGDVMGIILLAREGKKLKQT
jgi:hypothetical protein